MTNKILLLHGALGSRRQMDELYKLLSASAEVVSLNLPGHGGRPIPEAYSMNLFVEDVAAMLGTDEKPVDIFGFSMGGYVALLLAMKYPARVNRIMTLGTKFDWTPQTSARETLRLDPDKMTEKVPEFSELLRQRHAPQDWRQVVYKTRELLMRLGNGEAVIMSDFHLDHHVCILRGSIDHMVTAAESQFMANQLPHGIYEEMVGFRHPLEQTDPKILTEKIISFFPREATR